MLVETEPMQPIKNSALSRNSGTVYDTRSKFSSVLGSAKKS